MSRLSLAFLSGFKIINFGLYVLAVYLIIPGLEFKAVLLEQYALIVLISSFFNIGLGNSVLSDSFDDRLYFFIFILLLALSIVVSFFYTNIVLYFSIICGVATGFTNLLRLTKFSTLGLYVNMIIPNLLIYSLILQIHVLVYTIHALILLIIYSIYRKAQRGFKFSINRAIISGLENLKEQMPLLLLNTEQKLLLLQLMPILTSSNIINTFTSWNMNKIYKTVFSKEQEFALTYSLLFAFLILSFFVQHVSIYILCFIVLGIIEFKSGPKKSFFVKRDRLDIVIVNQMLTLAIIFGMYFFLPDANGIVTIFLFARVFHVLFFNYWRPKIDKNVDHIETSKGSDK